MKSKVDSLATLRGRSRLLAHYELFLGDYKKAFKELENYERVTPEKILQAANKYLAPHQTNITILSPTQPKSKSKFKFQPKPKPKKKK